MRFAGDDGAALITGAEITSEVDGTPGTNDMPGRLVFSTTADGAATPTERMRISSTGQTTISGNTIISVTDNTNAALRVTQLGSGNALLVEDSTNPDSTPVVIDSSGRVLIGNTTSYTVDATGLLQITGTTNAHQTLTRFTANAFEPSFNFGKSRGSSPSVLGIVSSGDSIGLIKFTADDGAAFIPAASILAAVDGTPGTNDMPGRLVFSTTADGAATPTERVRINSTGNVLIGTTTNTNSSLLVVNGEISETVGGVQYEVVSQADIGTAPNEIPLNQYLGNLAYQDAANIAGPVGVGGALSTVGVATFSAGTAAAPAITTTGDTNTGIFFPAADQVGIATNGVERVEFGNTETVFNDGGDNVDFRVEGDTNANLLFVDASADAIGIGTASPNASAILDAQSTTKGVRMPNMTTTQKNAIVSPAAGLMVFDTTLAKLSVYSGVAWETITSL
jgi:hypothetical protein